jgi:hypothetical protein
MSEALSTTALDGIELKNDRGETVRFADAWKDGPAILVWLRHFG